VKNIYLLLVIVIPSFSYAQWNSSGDNIYNTNTGSIGIGLNPTFGKVQISSGSDNNPALRLEQGGFSLNGTGIFQIDAPGIFGGRFHVSANGNIGVGINAPLQKMHISGSTAHGGQCVLIENIDNNFDSYAPIQFKTGASPSIWQTFARNGDLFLGIANVADYMVIKNGGNVSIGTAQPNSYKLAVAGTIGAWGEVRVFGTGSQFPDYVFDPSYKLPALEETEKYVKENHHLPEVPSAKDIAKDGMSLNDMNVILLKKVEELTLYMIEQQKINEIQSKEIKELKAIIKSKN
jgi:hypothetical protein